MMTRASLEVPCVKKQLVAELSDISMNSCMNKHTTAEEVLNHVRQRIRELSFEITGVEDDSYRLHIQEERV